MPGIAVVRSGYGIGLSLFNHTTRKLISYDRHRIFTRPKFENINRTIVEIISRYFLQVMYSVNAFVAHFNSVVILLQFHCNIDSNFCNYILSQFSLLFLRFYSSKKTQFLRHPYILLNDLFRTLFKIDLCYIKEEFAKLRALRAHVSMCLVYLRANVSCVLTYSRANVSCVLTWSRVLCAYVPTCLPCLRANVSYVLTCLRVNVPCVLTCSRAITSNNKKKFSVTYFPEILDTFSLSFSYEIKLYMKSAWRAGMSLETSILRTQLYVPAYSLTRRKPLTGAMTTFVQ